MGVAKGFSLFCVLVPGEDGPPDSTVFDTHCPGLAGSSGYLNEHVGS